MFGWGFNLVIRGADALKTAGSDWMLLLFVFDFTVAMAINDWQGHIATTVLKPAASAIFIACGLFVILSWAVVIKHVEPRIEKLAKLPGTLRKRFFISLAGWTPAVGFTAVNAWLFVHGV